MSLFPAYADDVGESAASDYEVSQECVCVGEEEKEEEEARLLASDEEPPPSPSVAPTVPAPDYYVDCKFDPGNLRVSTIYYPGRPQYEVSGRVWRWQRGRGERGERGERGGRGGRGERRARYYAAAARLPARDDAPELAERTRAYRRLLADAPHDERLWLRYIEFLERCAGGEAALEASEAARAALPGSRRVRSVLHALRGALPASARRGALDQELRAASGALRTELCVRRVHEERELPALLAATGRALHATRLDPHAYPHLLYVYGGYLRAAGLWELLTTLLELATSMNFPPGAFPPPREPAAEAEAERRLAEREDEAARSGLPAHTLWVRVERARAAAHWRAPARPDPLDPQRAPLAADVADLLLPAGAAPAAALLLVAALRLAKVPLLPRAQYALAAAGAGEPLDPHDAHGAELLAALARAARRLPPAHPARAPHAPALLHALLDPPHYFSPYAGYRAWVTALWDAACEWTRGDWRLALLCWRLRWLHALAVVLPAPGEPAPEEPAQLEARRLHREARAALKRWAGSSPLPYAHFARLERECARVTGAGGRAGAGAGEAALHALRAALREPAVPPHHRLYLARVWEEEDGAAGAGGWGTVCAALGEPLPEQRAAPPPPHLLAAALQRCEERAAQLERDADESEESVCAAMLPGAGEWAAARARLAPAPRRAELLRELLDAPLAEGALARYREHSACALVASGAREHRAAHVAAALAPLYPHNALLALAACGAGPRPAPAARAPTAALARALPALLRAAGAGWRADAARAAGAACARAGAGGGALLAAARLHAAGHGARAGAALPALLDALPLHKWVAVRGAWWAAREAPALADLLLERQLRLHALYEEVQALAGPALQ